MWRTIPGVAGRQFNPSVCEDGVLVTRNPDLANVTNVYRWPEPGDTAVPTGLRVHGAEDSRVVKLGTGSYCVVGCEHAYRPEIAPSFMWPTVARLDLDGPPIQIAKYVRPTVRREGLTHKNWVPVMWPANGGRCLLVTDIFPKVIVEDVDVDTGVARRAAEREWEGVKPAVEPDPADPHFFRNTTQFVPYRRRDSAGQHHTLLGLVHTRTMHFFYTYHYLELAHDFRPLRMSPAFVVDPDRFAFISGMRRVGDGAMLLTMGYDDNQSMWRVVPFDEIERSFGAPSAEELGKDVGDPQRVAIP
jgi:hypothetical protein